MSNRAAFVAALLLIGILPALAQNTPPTPVQPAGTAVENGPTLWVGDKAPALSVEKWVKGEPVTGFEKGKVYVVEFWATWCGACVKGFSHLTEVQKKYRDTGLTLIGVTAKYTRGDTLESVEKMVKEKGDGMGYTVAWDKNSDTSDAYMKAAGQNTLPCAFVVNQYGVIAYIGDPMYMDEPLKKIVAGTYDIQAAAEKYRAAAATAETDHAEAAAAKAARSFPQDYPRLLRRDPARAYELARKAIDSFAKDNPIILAQIAWLMVDPKANIENKDLDLALKAAARADELTNHKYAAIIDTVARVYFCKGDTTKAIELQKKAVSLAPDQPAQMKAEIEAALKEYEAAQKK